MAIVYMATNIRNGKRYVGVTVQRLHQRRAKHEYAALKRGANTRFSDALRKYGREAFAWAIIEEFDANISALEGEKRWIKTLLPEYNITSGGEGVPGLEHGEATRAKMRAAHTPERRVRVSALLTGRRHTEEAKARMSESHKGKPNLKLGGRKHTPDRVEKARLRAIRDIDLFKQFAHLGPEAASKRVTCLDTGEKFASASAAARHFSVAKSAVIELCLGKRGRKTVGGHRFAYLQEIVDVPA